MNKAHVFITGLAILFTLLLITAVSSFLMWGFAIGESAWTSNGSETFAGMVDTTTKIVPLHLVMIITILVLRLTGRVKMKNLLLFSIAYAVLIISLFSLVDLLIVKEIVSFDDLVKVMAGK
jgi:hypothetical protein